MQLESYEGVR